MPVTENRTPAHVDSPVSLSDFQDDVILEGNVTVRIGRQQVALSNLEKIYWPDRKITKGDLIRYYLTVGKTIMPHLKDRPAILKRFPNGIGKPAFYQHNVTKAPQFIQTIEVQVENDRPVHYAVYTNLASLIYLVNLGNIDQHAWLSRIDDLDHPDYVVFDLDPKGAPFGSVLQVALLMKEALEKLKLAGFVKTSGSSGIHIFVPVKRQYEFHQVSAWAENVANGVAERNSKIATTERRLSNRAKGQIYIDWQQNSRGKSIAAAYTVRPKPKATVSAPVSWAEVEKGFELDEFSIDTIPARIAKAGDLWSGLSKSHQILPIS